MPNSKFATDPTVTFSQTLEQSIQLTPEQPGQAVPLPVTWVGECIDDKHPTLHGRVQVEVQVENTLHTIWVPSLCHIPIRKGDRLLLLKPTNWDEPIVVGMVDGFHRRPEQAKEAAVVLELKQDEAVAVNASDGTALLKVYQENGSAAVRLMTTDISVQFPGKLSLRADELELEASRGPVKIQADDDVVVQGEVIHLN